MVTAVDVIEDQVDAHPQALAIRAEDGELTYAELDRAANRIAHAVLRADPDRRCANVGVLLPVGTTPLVAMLGAVKSGRAALGLDSASPAERVAELLDQAGPTIVVTDREHRRVLPAGTPAVLVEELADDLPTTRPRVAIDPDDPLQVTFTSGSTGRPKGAVRSHATQVYGIRRWRELKKYAPGTRVGLVYEVGFAASRTTLWCGFGNGCSVHVRDVRAHGPAGLARWLHDEQVARLGAPASLFDAMFEVDPPDRVLEHLEAVTFAGDLLKVATVERLRAVLGPHATIHNSYGSSEMGGVADFTITADTVLEGELVPAGEIRADVEVRIVDQDAHGVGEIVICGPMVSAGYVDDTTDRRGFLEEDGRRWFRSGDLGRIREDGLLEVVGRLDDRVKVREQTIDPAEVEAALLRLPGVVDAHVTAREVGGRTRLVAYVSPRVGHRLTVSGVRRGLRSALPDWMIPQSVVVLDPLPRTERGKVDRPRLPVPGAERPELDVPYAPPVNPLERVVVEAFQDVLGVEAVGRHDEFFDLGGDSLNAVEVVVALGRRIGRDLSLDAFRATATPAAIADRLARSPEVPADRLVELQVTGSGTPVVFVHAGHGYVITLAALADTTAGVRPFYGVQMLHRDRPRDLLSVPRLARRYADLLDERLPGPVVVAGYSGAGMLAHGLAAELRRRQREVPGLVLFDPVAPDQLPPGGPKARLYLLHALTGLRSPAPYRVRQRMAVSRRGARRYPAAPIDVPIAVLRGEFADPARWAPLTTSGVTTEDITGDHAAMLHPPHVAALGEVVERVVQRLEGRGPSAAAPGERVGPLRDG